MAAEKKTKPAEQIISAAENAEKDRNKKKRRWIPASRVTTGQLFILLFLF